MVLQRSTGMHQRDFEFPENLNQCLVHFEKREVTANAKMAATTKLQKKISISSAVLDLEDGDVPDKDGIP